MHLEVLFDELFDLLVARVEETMMVSLRFVGVIPASVFLRLAGVI